MKYREMYKPAEDYKVNDTTETVVLTVLAFAIIGVLLAFGV